MSLSQGRTALVVWAIGPGFVALAAWFVLAAPAAIVPRGEVRLVPLENFKPGAIRQPLTDPSKAVIAGVNRPCSECHRLFEPTPGEKRDLFQHKDIVLNHGMNKRCLNCHDGLNRDRFVLHDGTLVTFEEVPRLCSQCHGTLYRDWQLGMHGKTMNSWDATSGKQVRLACNQCHDPHAPAYKPFTPLPAPNTMRMGNQERHEEPETKHLPLRRWSEGGHKGEGHGGEGEKKPGAPAEAKPTGEPPAGNTPTDSKPPENSPGETTPTGKGGGS